ncbi:MAG: hypothetical protein AMJ54_04245 [Deltaproteobacteria bacterium SG8_13]|nr:MAG: hypothetical protein AMJ54_04245 [Deltaproteobacteria bacterium SG8_13]
MVFPLPFGCNDLKTNGKIQLFYCKPFRRVTPVMNKMNRSGRICNHRILPVFAIFPSLMLRLGASGPIRP